MKSFAAAAFIGSLFFGTMVCVQGQAKPPEFLSVAPAPSARFPASWYPADDKDLVATTDMETGAPYTATLVTTVHFLDPASREMKTISQSSLQARDSAGRKREQAGREVSVNDPVSHCSFQWMEPWGAPGKPTATARCMPRTLRYRKQNIWADAIVSAPREEHFLNDTYDSVPMGKRMFGDIEAVGVRRTKTTTNAQTGEVMKLVMEIWYSPELKELIEMKEIPDATRKSSRIPDFVLTEIHRGEPDPALFYPPAGYDITPQPNNGR